MALSRQFALALVLVVVHSCLADDPSKRMNPTQPYVIANAPIGSERKGFWVSGTLLCSDDFQM